MTPETPEAPVIAVVGVAKRFRRPAGGSRSLRRLGGGGPAHETWALRDVSFAVAPGEAVGLIGGNGAGKSTLLRIVAGVTRPTRGRVVVASPVSGLLTLGDGMQPLLTAEENAVTGAILAGLTREDARRRLPEVAAFAELEEHMAQPLRTFSDGMRLRLAFSVAVHVDPEILLVDEILAVGDLRFQEKCLEYLESLRARGTTIVLTSHSMEQVRRLCSRAVWLSHGKVRLDGAADEVTARYEHVMIEQAPPPEELPGGGMRVGTRDVEITEVRVLDAAGAPVVRLRSGDPLTVEVRFVAHRPVPGAFFGVGIHAEPGGDACLDVDTDGDRAATGPLDGPGCLTLEVERLDLAPGRYGLDVGVYGDEWEQVFDYFWAVRTFDVEGRGAKGVLSPPRRWRRA